MRQPPASGPGPGPQPGRGPGLPGSGPGPARPAGQLRLGDFAQGHAGDTCPPDPSLAAVLDRVSGPDRRCAQASDDELAGVLGRWAAVESWAAAGKLGVVAELIRRRARPGHEDRAAGGLPGAWEEGLGHELSLALALSVPGGDKLAGLAWELQARLPGIAALLAAGVIDALKAGIIAQELAVLDDALAARAEALLLDELAGKAPGQVARLAAAAVVAVDPAGAQRRRERAEREDARVRFWRERAGTGALAGYGLPADAALAANANISCRARQYKKARLDGSMDQLRVLAFLDILNGITADARITQARAQADTQARAGAGQAGDGAAGGSADDHAAGVGGGPAGDAGDAGDMAPGGAVPGRPDGRADGATAGSPDVPGAGGGPDDDGPADRGPADDCPTDDRSRDDESWDDGPRDDRSWDDGPRDDGAWDDGSRDDGPWDDGPGDGGPGGSDSGGGPGGGGPGGGGRPGGHGGGGPGVVPDAGAGAVLAASTNLTIPLAGLTALAARPGYAHALGPLDPGLARDLAAAAARSPHSTWCITITSPDGYAIGHGCARPARGSRGGAPPPGSRDGPWAFTRRDDDRGPPGGYGTWTLTLPDGRQLDVRLLPLPVTGCDHRYETAGYQPGDTLRHLTQVRDGTCTFPGCSRHARDCDFEHAIPYDQGGRTCMCNGGARSRRCHKVKQSRGWTVTQPEPGHHQWTTPSGRTYTQGPMKYPA